jgi:sugar O-acyltransferase (sialic acid O-acetyltransferase NeuD family)
MKDQPVVIFGGPGAGSLVAQLVNNVHAADKSLQLYGFLNDELIAGSSYCGTSVLGNFESWRELPEEVRFVAPLHKAKHMRHRAARINGLLIPTERWVSVIDPKAEISPDIVIAHGSTVAPFSFISANVNIGAHTGIRASTVIGHDSKLGPFCFVGHNSVLCGYVRVGEGAHIAPGALVIEHCNIGRYCVVGLGAVVVEDVPDFAIVAGNPAKIIGQANK